MSGWGNTLTVKGESYRCAYCEKHVGPNIGYASQDGSRIRICPKCDKPTYWDRGGKQTPPPPFGETVPGILEQDVESLFKEARDCTEVRAYTSAVMSCRKILMHIAVKKGAKEGLTFVQYVDYMAENHLIPPDSKPIADFIRTKGNEANHEIVIIEKPDAEKVLKFTTMLLRVVYELPALMK